MFVTLPRRARTPRAMLAIVAAAIALLTACSSSGSQGGGSATTPGTTTIAATGTTTPFPHRTGKHETPASHAPIVVIVLENQTYTDIVGSKEAPYLNNTLIPHGETFTNYGGVAQPSLPNYLAMTSGATHGKEGTDDITAGEIRGDNLFSQLSQAKVSWNAFQETLPSSCFQGAAAGTFPQDYALKHDPAMAYASVANSSLCKQVVPFTDLEPAHLPAFSFVTPNECNDAHSCAFPIADAWLAQHVPALLEHGATVIVTFDEASDNPGSGGHIPMVIAGAGAAKGTRNNDAYNHYSLLAGLETTFGVPLLGAAKQARPLPI